jgi:Flp pilus assembly protein TadG
MLRERTLARLASDCRGNTAIIFALGAIPLFLAAGAAVDSARAFRAQNYLQHAADSAALAAAASGHISVAEVRATVLDYMDANDAASAVTQLTSVDSVVDSSTGSITVTVKGEVATSLMQIMGLASMKVTALTEVSIGSRSLEMALVLDNTGSMNDFGKIADLKVAAKDLIGSLANGSATYSAVKFGIVPFSQYVNVGVTNSGASWLDPPASGAWTGCVGSRRSPADLDIHRGGKYPGVTIGVDDRCPAEVTPLTNNVAQLYSEIDSMVATGSTYIAGGLFWGWNILDPKEPFTEAMTNSQRKKAQGQRVLVLMTDGANTLVPIYPQHGRIPQSRTNSVQHATELATANSNTAALCAGIKKDGIKIYTVVFKLEADSNTSQTEVDSTKAMLSDCASEPSMAYDVANGAGLKVAFQHIADDLVTLHLAR